MGCTCKQEAEIARWTTPSFLYKPQDFEMAEVAEVYLVIKQNGAEVIRKNPDETLREEEGFLWTLAQEETGRLEAKKNAIAKIDGILNSGTRFTTIEKYMMVVDSAIQEVI